MIELTRKLTEAWGPSGYEHHVRQLIQEEVAELADEMQVDPLGNLICKVGKGDTRIMIAAHMDEIGLMATYVEPKSGYLRFANIGGLLHTSLLGNRVRFEDGTIGVIGVHDAFGVSRTSVPELDSFYIDVSDGANGSVQPGSPGAFAYTMEVRGTRLVGKAMDDRIGCVVAIETMRKLKKKAKNEVYFVFTVQEEVGLRGARPAAYNVNPDVAIALDVTATGDEIKNDKMAVKLGGGAAIKLHDPGLVVPPAVRDWMIERAEKDGIAYQRELLTKGTTDASGIQMARAGVPSGCISIPCRFIHTTSETVDTRDVQACIDLLTGLVKNPAKL
ncbi:MAG: M20/M25/M40 family metallo-hydrolase [Chloroflexi bacterium]|nr:M20/M25/M40 family metallo-hydrolase [Chloroflexota bacterium]